MRLQLAGLQGNKPPCKYNSAQQRYVLTKLCCAVCFQSSASTSRSNLKNCFCSSGDYIPDEQEDRPRLYRRGLSSVL